MISRARPIALLVATLAPALLVAGCGEDEKGAKIPAANAQQLVSLLDEVDRRIRAGNACGDIRDDFPALEQQSNDLPDDVDSNTRETLEEGIAHLRELVDEECGRIQEEKQRTTETTETTPTIAPPPTETETETTDTETETEPPTIPEPPTDDGGGGQQAPGEGGGGIGPDGGEGDD